MHRNALHYLDHWLDAEDRKPLIVRGARQVGKTWLVRYFAEKSGKKCIELNFERQPSQASLFASNDPRQILLHLGALQGQTIDPNTCLLFLDEIQAAPDVLSKLRWFAEDFPALPVIAAGSLLEFTLAEHTFSMPVGRIQYLHLEPLSFEEFLQANDKQSLYEYIVAYDLKHAIPTAIHDALLSCFKEYMLVGGLPAVVKSWVAERAFDRVHQIQHDLLATYRDDFAKYKGRIAIERLDEVLMAVPRMLAQKVVCSRVNSEVQASTIKQVLDLLQKARICHRISCCAANGIPLAAEIKEKYFKEIFLDTGLCCVVLGLHLHQLSAVNDITLINQGGLAEQVVGQMLRTIQPPYVAPALYYWLREEKGSNAEIDYLLQYGSQIIPIEVKAGNAGSLKSLHVFMGIKALPLAVRIYSGLPNTMDVETKDQIRGIVRYKLLSIPFYLTGQIERLLGE